MAETRLVLIRHGESQVTVDGIVGGHKGCTGLSPLGRKQAEALRDRLQRTGELSGASALYASVLPRAVETAEIIAPSVGSGDLAVVQECGVCETHAGEADGLTWDEFRERFGPPGPSLFTPWAPGSESWASFVVRAGVALEEIAARHPGETVVISCHGGVVAAGFIAFGRLSIDTPFEIDVANTSITEWRRGERKPWRLERFNDAAHLADLADL